MKHTTIGKRLLTILLSLVMACALCVPAMAEESSTSETRTGQQLRDLFETALPEAETGNRTIDLKGETYDLTGYTWTPIYVDGYNGAGVVTVDGNGAVITNLNAPLFAGGFAGNSGIVIKNLTIKDSVMTDSTESQGMGAFIKIIDSMPKIELNDCHLQNVNITSTGGARVGGLIGWTAGYNVETDGPVDTYVTIRDCSVTNCTVTANGSVGAIIGHAGTNPATYHNIENCTVTNTTLHSTDADDWRVGVVVGTANVGKVNISNITESGNELTQTGKTMPEGQSNLYGRLSAGNTGALVIDNKLVNGSKGVVATVVDQNNHSTMYGTLVDAVAAAGNGSTITIWKDLSEKLELNRVSDITINGNGHTIDLRSETVQNGKEINAIDLIGCQNIQIENLNIKGAYTLNNGKFATGVKHGINSYHSTITVKNVTVEGCGGYGLVCNGSTAEVDGMTTSKNRWGGLNADSRSQPVATMLTVKNATCEELNSVRVENDEGKGTVPIEVIIENGRFKAVSKIHNKTDITVRGGEYAMDVQSFIKDSALFSVPDAVKSTWTVKGDRIPLTVTMDNVSVAYGETATFTYAVTGKLDDDSISVTPQCTYDKNVAGNYTIGASVSAPVYYDVKVDPSVLTVLPKPGTETGTTDTVVMPEVPKVDESANPSEEAKKVANALVVDEEGVALNGLAVAKELEASGESMKEAEEKLADVRAEGDTILLVVKPYVEIKPTTIETSADGKVQKVNLEITMKYDIQATIPGKKTVEISTGNTMSKEQIKADTTITVPVPTGFATTEAFVRHVTGDNNVYYYSTKLIDGKFEFTVPAEHGFSPFTLMSNSNVTVKLDGKDYTYTSLDVVNGTALPAASKYNYAFKGWKFEGIDGQYFNMTAELFEALLDKNAVVIGSSVFEGPLSEHPEIEEAKKNGTWGVDENKPAATAKPAAAAAVTPVRSSIPKTSDDSNLMLWVCLMGLAALGLGGALYLKKRGNK